jgi:hypothetical protein
MVSVKQFSILSVFLVAFAESALGAPLASNNLALRSEVDSDLALQLAIRDLLEEVDLDDRDLEYQLEELMARAPPVPQPKRKNAILVPPKPSGGGSQGQSITGLPITQEPKPIKPASKFRRGPPAPQPRPQPPKRKNAVVVPPPRPSGGGGSITGRPVTKEPRPIKPVSKFRRGPPAPQARPQPKRKNAIVVPPKPSGGGSQGQSITGLPITQEPKPIKPASKFRRGPPASQPRPQPPKRKNAVVVPPPKPSGGGSKSITGRPVTKEPRPIKPASKF